MTEEIKEVGETVIEAIKAGGDLPPEPGHDHGDNHGKPPSDSTVVVVSVLYIAGGAFMIWLGVSALRAMQKRKKEGPK